MLPSQKNILLIGSLVGSCFHKLMQEPSRAKQNGVLSDYLLDMPQSN